MIRKIKRPLIFITLLFVLSVLFTTISATTNTDNLEVVMQVNTYVENKNHDEYCCHSLLYDFDDEAMVVNGVYEGNCVVALLDDIEYYSDNHYAKYLRMVLK